MNVLYPSFIIIYLNNEFDIDIAGLYSYYLSISTVLLILLNFGFNIIATKDIVSCKGNEKRIRLIYSIVQTIKLSLFVLILIIGAITVVAIGLIITDPLLLLFIILTSLNSVLVPQWLFHGLKNLRSLSIPLLLIRIVSIIILLFILPINIYIIYIIPLLQLLFDFVLFLYIKYKNTNIYYNIPSLRLTFVYLKKALPFLTSRVASSLTIEGNSIILGAMNDLRMVLVYEVGKRILYLSQIPLLIVVETYFPKVIESKSSSDTSIALYINITIAAVIAFTVSIYMKNIGSYFGLELNDNYLPVLQLILLTIFLYSVTYVIGNLALVSNGHYKAFNNSVILQSVAYIIVSVALIIFNKWSLIIGTLVFLISVCFQLLYRIFAINYYQNIKFKLT